MLIVQLVSYFREQVRFATLPNNEMRRLINFILRKLKPTKYEQYIKKQNKYGTTDNDDFNWEFYNLHYRSEMKNLEKEFTTLLSVGDYKLTVGGLKQTNEEKSLFIRIGDCSMKQCWNLNPGLFSKWEWAMACTCTTCTYLTVLWN